MIMVIFDLDKIMLFMGNRKLYEDDHGIKKKKNRLRNVQNLCFLIQSSYKKGFEMGGKCL